MSGLFLMCIYICCYEGVGEEITLTPTLVDKKSVSRVFEISHRHIYFKLKKLTSIKVK